MINIKAIPVKGVNSGLFLFFFITKRKITINNKANIAIKI